MFHGVMVALEFLVLSDIVRIGVEQLQRRALQILQGSFLLSVRVGQAGAGGAADGPSVRRFMQLYFAFVKFSKGCFPVRSAGPSEYLFSDSPQSPVKPCFLFIPRSVTSRRSENASFSRDAHPVRPRCTSRSAEMRIPFSRDVHPVKSRCFPVGPFRTQSGAKIVCFFRKSVRFAN